MKAMRRCRELSEIDSTLDFFFKQEMPLLLWQNLGLNRTKFRSQIIFSNSKSRKLFLKIHPSNENLEIVKNEDLYFYGEYKSTIFKSSMLSQKQNSISIFYPTSLNLQEYRTAKRQNVLKYPNCTVTLNKVNPRGFNEDFTYRLNDISDSGFSFIVNQTNKEQFAQGERIVIKQIINDKIVPLTASVRHISKFAMTDKLTNPQLNKVGLRFDHAIDLSSLYIYRKFLAYN